MNNQINKIKRRADALADFFIERYERLEKENHQLETRGLKLRTHEIAFEKALKRIIEIKKAKRNNNITIIFKGKGNNGVDKLFTDFTQDDPMYLSLIHI